MRMLALAGAICIFALGNTACRTTQNRPGSNLATIRVGNLTGNLDYDELVFNLGSKENSNSYSFRLKKADPTLKETVEPGRYYFNLLARKGDKTVASSDFAPCQEKAYEGIRAMPGDNVIKIDICTSDQTVISTQTMSADIELQPEVKAGFYFAEKYLQCFDKELRFQGRIMTNSNQPTGYFALDKETVREKTNDLIHLTYLGRDFNGSPVQMDLKVFLAGDTISKVTLSAIPTDQDGKPQDGATPATADFLQCRIKLP